MSNGSDSSFDVRNKGGAHSDRESRPEQGMRSGDPSISERPVASEQSFGELTSRLANEMSELVRTHIELAKEETRTELRSAGKGAGMLGGGALAANLALILLSFAAAWGLDAVIPTGFAFLIVGIAWVLIAGVLGLTGKKKIEHVDPTPTATIEELQEDKQWLKNQT